MDQCLPRICKYMLPVEVSQLSATKDAVQFPFKKYTMWFENFELRKPQRSLASDQGLKNPQSSALLPYECRIRSLTYSAPMYATVCRRIDDEPVERVTLSLGDVPVIVRSKHCNLNDMTEEELAHAREDMHEFGGYFIVNGNERLVRMLIMNKRNYPVCFERSSFCNRGRFFSPYAV
jgi:DNA-directed RNA polymerase I subunit RPA2